MLDLKKVIADDAQRLQKGIEELKQMFLQRDNPHFRFLHYAAIHFDSVIMSCSESFEENADYFVAKRYVCGDKDESAIHYSETVNVEAANISKVEQYMFAFSMTRASPSGKPKSGFLAYYIAANRPRCSDPTSVEFGDVPCAPHLFIPKQTFFNIYHNAVMRKFNKQPERLELKSTLEYFHCLTLLWRLLAVWIFKAKIVKTIEQFVFQCMNSSDIVDNLLCWLNIECGDITYFHNHLLPKFLAYGPAYNWEFVWKFGSSAAED